jgi:heme-degrading monooxygenase HmoA
MASLLVRHKVKDYAKWKPVFDEHGATRKKGGSKGARVFRNANDPSEILIITEWADLKQAHAFAESPDLREVMERAGVIGKPDLFFLEETDKQSA